MTIKQIIDNITNYETIIIHRHIRPDPDAFGSQGGLRELIKASFPEKQVFMVGEEDPSLKFLVEMDKVPDEAYRGALVIACDTANAPRIDDDRYSQGSKLLKIDHHPNVHPYGDINWVDTGASSTSEMIYDLYLHGREAGWQLNDRGARLLYAGIVGDTGRFLFPNATEKTFSYAGELVDYSFDRAALYDGLYSMEEKLVRLKGYILQNCKLSEEGVCVLYLDKGLLDSYNVEASETSRLVGIPDELMGIKAWVYFIEESDQIRVRLRSKGPVINELAAKYNGGGHPMASGATVYSWEEAERLAEDLKETCRVFGQK
ncbi:bifunctional oligoribonuclease/PAP phosphatase NrnA [Virgibacillus xinjiangensis]|uniref:Bifunctional oligoribonuclease/PAP phosphatase NrnA n=1 Tax=Virgibacillus xinjiangensis TaxID=393090 RepID=A0ABV7CVC4_9BACI